MLFVAFVISDRSFSIVNNDFMKDGERYQYVSGSFHYFREISANWEDRLKKMAAGGYTTVQTYVAWNVHQPQRGVFNWQNDADLGRFIDLCAKWNLTVILRPGPYICAEWNFGGFPVWLHNEPGIKSVRSTDPAYLAAVEQYFTALGEIVKPRLYANGGPIIMIQIENEYGSYPTCSKDYLQHLKELWVRLVGSNVVYFTTDGNSKSFLNCGADPGIAYATVDFGVGSNVMNSFELERSFNGGHGPYVNSEFYSGWLSHWHEKFQTVAWSSVCNSLGEMLGAGGNVNVYMAFGGTSLHPGANGNVDSSYQPQTTSYDYDAPISEAGDLTYKWAMMRDKIAQFRQIPQIDVANSTKKAYGAVSLTQGVALLDVLSIVGASRQVSTPALFDELEQDYGFIYYETVGNLKGYFTAKAWDRGVVLQNGGFLGSWSRPFDISTRVDGKIGVLVETIGRLNYGSNFWDDWKGLKDANLDSKAVNGWVQWSIPLSRFDYNLPWKTDLPTQRPAFYRGQFQVSELADTFLNPTGLTRGSAFVNGVYIGSYWTDGAQLTLYIRAQQLKIGTNELVIFDTTGVEQVPTLSLDDHPQLNIPPS